MIEHVTCKVCGQILNNYKCLGHHIKRDHQLTSVQYYEQYVEQSNDNYKCPFCNNKRKFKNINEGFRKTCGSACCEQQQTKATNIQKYGCSNVFQSDAIKQRIYATKEQRYNNPKYVNVKKARKTRIQKNNGKWHADDYYDKCSTTCLKHYGVVHYTNGRKISQTKQAWTDEQKKIMIRKMKRTKYKKYGDCFYTNRQKNRETCLSRYGTTNTWVFTKIGKISSLNKRIFKILNNKHVFFKSEMHLSDKISSYFYDIAFNNKVLLEINGDFWHANPEQYKATDILNLRGRQLSAADIWKKDKLKKQLACNFGYQVVYIWESRLKQMTDDEVFDWILKNCLFI